MPTSFWLQEKSAKNKLLPKHVAPELLNNEAQIFTPN
jgi:hypothetical protein